MRERADIFHQLVNEFFLVVCASFALLPSTSPLGLHSFHIQPKIPQHIIVKAYHMAARTPPMPSIALAAPAPRCILLELPGELKNRIYRLAMVTSDRENAIYVTPGGYDRCGLVQTCKQVYAE